jgi:ribulose-phosphate 3-epimerase
MTTARSTNHTSLPGEPGIRVAPSLLAADFSRLAEHVGVVERAGAEVLHLDVMDGHFVPNISFGPGLIARLRPHCRMFFDTHLMIEEPARYAADFAKAGSDLITFHIEVAPEPREVIAAIRAAGAAVGVSINPATDVDAIASIVGEVDLVLVMSVWPGFGGQKFMGEVLGKVERLRGMLGDHQRLEIDGGIDGDTISQAVRAGADTLVAGTSVFGAADAGVAWRDLTLAAQRAAEGVVR